MSGKARSVRSGRGGGARHHPYERAEQMETEENSEFETPANSIKVSSSCDPRTVAATVTQAFRSKADPPTLLTIGNNSINQAVKVIAIARAELKVEGVDIAFQPAFRHVNRTRPLIAFYLSQCRVNKSHGNETQLTVGSGSKIVSVAGAVSGRIREGAHVVLTAIGVDAVTNAVLAAGNARLFLEQDQLDVKVQPEFFKIQKGDGELNGLKFIFHAESI